MNTNSTALTNNTFYDTVLPKLILVLSSIYVTVYLIQSLRIIQRKKRYRKEEKEKRLLKYYWKCATLRDELHTDQEKAVPYPQSVYPCSSSSTIVKETPCKLGEEKHSDEFWSKRQSKRLKLIWQWSVSMGYCEYPHGKQLNDLIHVLSSQETL
ncbi:hypothetical protein BY458DRAFT_559002 [Sporodiniella umbellata]|nr:hypothetical protein BY458DRAFT_559002 [Sporodiniella umbellata]